VNAAGWGELLIAVAVVAGLPGIYALRRRATIPGLVTLAIVTFGLFTLWLLLSVSYVMSLYGALGERTASMWPVVIVLVGMAAAVVGAAWYGWHWHQKLYSSGPRGEQALPADGGKLAQ